MCHEDIFNAFQKNPHQLVEQPGDADRICLTCHRNQSTHSGRINSSHAKNQVSCTACHSIHKNGPHGLVARKPVEINALCAACHTDVWASFQKPYKQQFPHGSKAREPTKRKRAC
jgi:predicted CXXCH cytochrome family protein